VTWEIRHGDALAVLRTMPDESVQTCVTSPPFWGLRDYGVEASAWPEVTFSPIAGLQQITVSAQRAALGLESEPWAYVAHLIAVFREARRVLRNDGTLWLNLGDCYATGAYGAGASPGGGKQGARWRGDVDRLRDDKRGYRAERLPNGRRDQEAVLRRKTRADRDGTHAGKHTAMAALGPISQPNRMPVRGLKPKDLVGIPWRVAFALQADGWWLRSDIVRSNLNPMPESVQDRPTRSHEYVFLLARSKSYRFDAEAVREPDKGRDHARRVLEGQPSLDPSGGVLPPHRGLRTVEGRDGLGRNIRSVWTIATQPFPEAHFATFPPALVEPCIKAGSREGDVVLDPFAGAGTTGLVATRLGRRFVGIELNAAYVEMARRRIVGDAPLLNAEVSA